MSSEIVVSFILNKLAVLPIPNTTLGAVSVWHESKFYLFLKIIINIPFMFFYFIRSDLTLDQSSRRRCLQFDDL